MSLILTTVALGVTITVLGATEALTMAHGVIKVLTMALGIILVLVIRLGAIKQALGITTLGKMAHGVTTVITEPFLQRQILALSKQIA